MRYQAGFQFDWRAAGACPTGNGKKLFLLLSESGSRLQLFSENHHIVLYTENHLVGTTQPGIPERRFTEFTPEDLGRRQLAPHYDSRKDEFDADSDGRVPVRLDRRQSQMVQSSLRDRKQRRRYAWPTPAVFNDGSPVAQSEWMDNLSVWEP